MRGMRRRLRWLRRSEIIMREIAIPARDGLRLGEDALVVKRVENAAFLEQPAPPGKFLQ